MTVKTRKSELKKRRWTSQKFRVYLSSLWILLCIRGGILYDREYLTGLLHLRFYSIRMAVSVFPDAFKSVMKSLFICFFLQMSVELLILTRIFKSLCHCFDSIFQPRRSSNFFFGLVTYFFCTKEQEKRIVILNVSCSPTKILAAQRLQSKSWCCFVKTLKISVLATMIFTH